MMVTKKTAQPREDRGQLAERLLLLSEQLHEASTELSELVNELRGKEDHHG